MGWEMDWERETGWGWGRGRGKGWGLGKEKGWGLGKEKGWGWGWGWVKVSGQQGWGFQAGTAQRQCNDQWLNMYPQQQKHHCITT